MRKLFIPIEFLFYWLVIVTIFLLGPLFADAATSDNLSITTEFHYSLNNISEIKNVYSSDYLQTFNYMHDDFIKKFTFNKGAYGYTQLHNYSDAKSNAFVSTDFISFRFYYNINYDLINADYYYLVFHIYIMPGLGYGSDVGKVDEDTFANYNIIQKSNMQIWLSYNSDNKYGPGNTSAVTSPCIVTPVSDQDAVVGCRVKKEYYRFSSNSPVTGLVKHDAYFNIALSNLAYSELSSDDSDSLVDSAYRFYINKRYTYDVSENSLDLNVNVDGSTINVTAIDGLTKPIEHIYYNINYNNYSLKHGEIYEDTRSFSIDDIPNGKYSIEVVLYYEDGTHSVRGMSSFQVIDSLFPVLLYTISRQDNCFVLDMTKSYSPSGLSLTYFYKGEDNKWYEIPKGKQSFCDDTDSFGYELKVVDSEGRTTYDNAKWSPNNSPTYNEDDTRSWLEKLLIAPGTSFSDFFTDIGDTVKEKLGFMYYPIEFFSDFCNRIIDLEDIGSYVISWPSVKVPNFDFTIINAGSYDLASILNDPTIKNWHDYYFIFFDGLLIIAFFNLCINKINNILGIVNEDFSSSIVESDTDLMRENPDTGVVTRSRSHSRTYRRRRPR